MLWAVISLLSVLALVTGTVMISRSAAGGGASSSQ